MIALRVTGRPETAAAGAERCLVKAEGCTIGRAADCDLVLDDPMRTVSRRQAVLRPVGAHEALLRCISSSVEIEVNGVPVGPQVEHSVRPGDRLRIGAFELEVESEGVDPTIPGRPLPRPPPEPPAGPATVVAAPRERRIDRWFDLDHAPDPMGAALPRARPAEPAPVPTVVDWDRLAPDPVAPMAAPPAVAAAAPGATDADELRRAFLRGAGLAEQTPLPFTPATLQHLGALMRDAVETLLDQLQGRSIVKRGLRAQTTHIGERENNPLKFAPGGAEALRVLLAEKPPAGFLPPLQAMQDARRDLQAHQLAVAAGMRAVLDELLARLGPREDAGAAPPRGGWKEALPLVGDAERWRRHCERHAELMAGLDDTVESLFQREFRAAYQARIEQAQREGGAAPR